MTIQQTGFLLLTLSLLAATACESTGRNARAPLDSIVGDWTLTQIAGDGGAEAPVEGARPTLSIHGDGQVSGFSGVNRYTTSLSVDHLAHGQFSLGPVVTTRMAGPPEAMNLESQFLETLERVSAYSAQGDVLVLEDTRGGAAPLPQDLTMKEILPHIYHWSTNHPRIGVPVSSYYLADESILIDPLIPEEGMDWFKKPPRNVLLTNRHHYRDSDEFAESFGSTVWCVEAGMQEFTNEQPIEAFRFGETLAGGIVAIEIGAICPDETALYIPKGDGLVALADGIVREGDGPLSFVPDTYIGDDPQSVKDGLKQAYRQLLERNFDHLLLAHGDPWIGGGKQALTEFIDS